MRVKITLERVVITLVSVKTCQNYSRMCIKHTLRVKSHSACGNHTLRLEVNLVRVKSTLERVLITFVRVVITLVNVIITLIHVKSTLCV
jgi:hypothetical protein